MFDCSKFYKDCHAACCGVIPIEKELYKKNTDKIVTQPLKVEEYHDIDPFDGNKKKTFAVPITPNNKCCFLKSDYKCAIYADRPNVCKIYGDESIPILLCRWQDKNGNKRSRQAKRFLNRISKKNHAKYLKHKRKHSKSD